KLRVLQNYLSLNLPKIKNDVDVFGYQLLVNEKEEIVGEEEYLLISAISQNISQIATFVHSLGGVFIPAHIDKMQNSVISQLGFLPPDLKVDALELSKRVREDEFISKNKYLSSYNFIRSSDAHYREDFAVGCTFFYMEELTFDEIKMALHRENGRYTEICYE
ncbi:MAG: PHP domain-containing protein, partial [Rikenellaceae bacterium]